MNLPRRAFGAASDAAIADIMKYVFIGDPQGPAKIIDTRFLPTR